MIKERNIFVPQISDRLDVGLAALDIFLQANVTGPVVPAGRLAFVQSRFSKAWTAASPSATDQSAALRQLQRACLAHLEADGVSPYDYIPHLELFSLARYVFNSVFNSEATAIVDVVSQHEGSRNVKYSIPWLRLRINVWHYKLLTQPSLSPGSSFTKSSQWSEVPSLVTSILTDMDTVRSQIAGDEVWSEPQSWDPEDKAYFLVEAANNYILLGRHEKAREALKEATQTTGLKYALSGALGKRTKFQENSISQLVVLARSGTDHNLPEKEERDEEEKAKPDALNLNDDTLLEEIQFSNDSKRGAGEKESLPSALAELSPDNQPQLAPLDQIILLAEATLKDAFSPADTLTSQEILPYAVRVLGDKSTNWQIYTQALLVRSRIEVHRSRTVERGILQLQAVADQVLTDTTVETKPTEASNAKDEAESEVPAIQITTPDQENLIAPPNTQAPTSFLPRPKASESAPAHVRLRYIDALSTPPRWHLESELAYAWAGVGSLTSALEIFKRLRLWAEVALCYASAAASEDEDGRGGGGEEKAKSIVRWRLFRPTGEDASAAPDPADQSVEDVMRLKASSFRGPERSPPPPNAARLWCILGDLENDPTHYEKAWLVSKHRYARAQKSLGEYYLLQKDMAKACEAYELATSVNRLSPDLWSRLGDISLRLGRFEKAAEAYSRSIGCANDVAGGEDARTWSNLGSALWSQYCEVTAENKDAAASSEPEEVARTVDGDEESRFDAADPEDRSGHPATLLTKSLAAYKKGASMAHDNWRIWDNVLTLAARFQPPNVPDMLLALTHVLRIRKTEDAIDTDVLTTLVQDVVVSKEKPEGTGVYEPPRGSTERLVIRLVEEEVVPLITQRAELWSILSRLRAWRRDYAGAIDASERAWRAAVGSSGSGLLPGEVAADSADWTTDVKGWTEVVQRTDELVSMLENWGHDVEAVRGRWKGKARSAIRSVMGRGKENWEGSEGWSTLEGLMDGLKASR
ncbi:hypothetical protein ED733_008561 [Metarhizium rileyi]|uniref:Uncharacterized protein n=1 Tax=Metarhizium rileyi (strain RCEF 4871) TaxID=1649241 RepID=A0A5C6GPV2_METRR|nr:hypothetical protein ED733_008561 [Metarhizium rileyi]